jgi:hypothetical protein
MARRQAVVRLGIPALLVSVLAAIALWRVGVPADPIVPTERRTAPGALGPLTTIAEVATQGAIGRRASLENIEVREVVTPRTFWYGPADAVPSFAVLDPDVRRVADVAVAAGARLTLIGLVRPSPPPERAMRQWQLDEPTARVVTERGTYLHVTEVRPGS